MPAERAREALRELRERREEMVELAVRLVERESPSRDPEATRRALGLVADELEEIGLSVRRLRGDRTAGHLFARPPDAGEPCQLLIGHVDTVWPVGTLERMPVARDGDRLSGPGVFDMKAGLAQLLFALRVLRDRGWRPELAPAVLVTTDEEIGSPESERWVRRLARASERALVLEPALGPEGSLKTARKGTGHFEFRVIGRGSHAGIAPEEGVSAIQELSHLVQALHAISDPERGVSVNVGEIRGGTRPNVVAAEAHAVVDVRVPSAEEARRVEGLIRSVEPATPGARLEIEGGMGRPPMERTPGNRALWRAARGLGEALGLELTEATSGGASDANLTSLYTPTLDGLGPVGGGAHAEDEHVEIASMPERSALLAGLLLLPADVAAWSGRPASRAGATDRRGVP